MLIHSARAPAETLGFELYSETPESWSFLEFLLIRRTIWISYDHRESLWISFVRGQNVGRLRHCPILRNWVLGVHLPLLR